MATYTYDAANRLASVRDWDNRTTTYAYDDAGRLTGTAYPNGTSAALTYDNADRLTSLVNQKGAATITSHSYTLDAVGNRTQAAENIGTSTYAYDNLYRLTSVTYPGPSTATYTYSPTGNRLTKLEGGTTTYTYDAADRMTAAGGTAYIYDANGNQTGRGADSFSYDAANRMTQNRIGSTTTTYTYNGDGVRVKKRAGNKTTDYVLDTNRSLPVVLHDGDAFYLYGLDLIARITTTGPAADRQRYYHYDGLGSTRALTDANGNTDATYNYDVFGAIRSSTGTAPNDFRYTAEQLDAESQYYFLRARYYDPGIGRFISRDPIGWVAENPQALNAYVYVSNSPVNLVDRSGLTSAPPLRPPSKDSAPGRRGADRPFECRGFAALFDCGAGGERVPGGGVAGGAAAAGGAPAVGQAIQNLQQFLQSGEGFWLRVGAFAERATGRVYLGGTSMEEMFVNIETGMRLYRHIIVRGGEILHETFREYSKFGVR